MGMEFGIEKCTIFAMKRETMEEIVLPNQESSKHFEKKITST